MRLKFTSTAESDLAHLEKPIARLVYKRLVWFAENFDSTIRHPLKDDLKEYNKFRVGDYRIWHTLEDSKQELIIHFIRHRRDVYKDK